MKILAVKRPTRDERLGYLKGVLVNENGNWVSANKTNLPEGGEAFIHTNYKLLDQKFQTNELIIAEVSELLDTGDRKTCFFGGRADDTENVTPEHDLVTIFKTYEKIANQDYYNIESNIKPPIFSFLETTIDEETVLLGPMSLVTTTFNEESKNWESRLNLTSSNNRKTNIFPKLEPYNVYQIPLETLPENMIIKGEGYFNSNIQIATGLLSYIRTVPTTMETLISDSTLIRLIDNLVTSSEKLGRKKKRELAENVEASKLVKPNLKPKFAELFKRMEEQDDAAKVILTEAVAKYSNEQDKSPENYNIGSEEQKKKIEELQKNLEEIKEELKTSEDEKTIVTQEKENLEAKVSLEKASSTDTNVEEVESLKKKITEMEERATELDHLTDLEAKKTKLDEKIVELDEHERGLSDTVSRLKSDLQLNMGQFRTKALEVLPFFEIMNNVRSTDTDATKVEEIDPKELFVAESLPELINTLADRVKQQGYKAEESWLKLVSCLFLSNKYIGLFGDPGTGKTSLAKCFQNALSNKLSSVYIPVGRGWSSFVDFIGYDNSFTGQFKYKNNYLKRFESDDTKHEIFNSLIFDEATLSSPEHYLSSFIGDTDLNYSNETEAINLDGHSLYFPKDTKMILTFNVDETTEQLSKRFISRMPVIYLTQNSDFSVEITNRLKEKSFPTISKIKADELIKKEFTKKSSELEALGDEFENRYNSNDSHWKKIIGELSPRKKIQIDNFLGIASSIIDDEIDSKFIIDFVEDVFFLPMVEGHGDEYLEILDQAIPSISSPKARRRIANIKKNGQRYNIFRHI